jgi:hypothetical protein
LSLDRRCRLAGLTGGLRTATATTSAPPATLVVGRLRTRAFGAGAFGSGRRGSRDDPSQTAWPAPAARLLAGHALLLDSILELGQPLFHRALDLRPGRARLLGPDARPIGADGFGRRIGVSRFRLDRNLRRKFWHLRKS